MNLKINISYAITVALLAGLSFFPIAMPSSFKIDEERNPMFQTFPYELGEWAGTDSEVDQKTYEILETRNVLSRNYANRNGQKVHLLLVSSNKDRRVAHPPEVCYTGANYTITEEKDSLMMIQGSNIPVREFYAKSERRANHGEHVLYLYKIGDSYTTNYYSQQLKFAIDQISKKRTDILLVRVSTRDKELLPAFLDEVIKLIES